MKYFLLGLQKNSLSETKHTILIADDEPDILEILQFHLTAGGYKVHTVKDGDDALDAARRINPDLIILDMMMPKKNGMEVCELLKAQIKFKETPILFLTALNDEATHIKGLETGADDYISKPVSPKVLLSRINAHIRRIGKKETGIIKMGEMTIDPERYIIATGKDEYILAKKEFELLYLLAQKPGKVFLRNEILNQVWGYDVIVGDRTIDVHIRKIRQKLGIDCITTVKGVGYKFEL
jgi:two-component system alkaline phosphatase synthesis response regulator PhoP